MRILNLILGVVLLLPAGTRRLEAQDITFGITANDPSSVQRGIEEANREHATRVVVPPGIYRLSCPDGWTKRMGSTAHLVFTDLANLEIDAEKVTFVATTRDIPSIRFYRCHHVTLKGATFVHDIPPFSQGEIVAIAPDLTSVDIQVDTGYPADIADDRYFGHHIPCINVYDPKTGLFKPGIADLWIHAPVKLSPRLFRFGFNHAQTGPLAVGDRVAWRGCEFADVVSNYCENMTFDGVTLKACSMQGFSDTMGTHDSYLGCTITYGPKPDGATRSPLLSTNADGYFLTNCRQPMLINCRAEGLDDDGIALRSSYALGISSEGETIVCDSHSIRLGPPGAGDFFHVGDHLRFYETAGVLAGEAQVTAIQALPDYQMNASLVTTSRVFKDSSKAQYTQVTLDHPVPMQFDWRVANADELCNGFTIRGCVIRNLRNAAMRIKAGNGVIEGCTVENILNYGLKISPETQSFNEADYARDVVIRNNTFRNVNLGHLACSAIFLGCDEYPVPPPLPGGHRNITINHNLFIGHNGIQILATSTQGLTITDNTFDHPMQAAPPVRPGLDTSTLLSITQCSDVLLQGNIAVQPGPFLGSTIVVDPSVQGTGLTDGITKN